jgi:hypothetical protein
VATRPSDQPLLWAGLPLALVGGGMLGHKATDRTLDWVRRREQKGELEAARRRYELALQGKSAAIDALRKEADWSRIYGVLGGVPALLAGLGLSAGAYYGLAAGGNRTPDAVLRKAMEQRRRRLFSEDQPAELEVPTVGPPGEPAKAAAAGDAARAALGRMEQRRQQQWGQVASAIGLAPPARPAPAAKPAAPAPAARPAPAAAALSARPPGPGGLRTGGVRAETIPD